MMQANEIQKRFSNIERSIAQASKACRSSNDIPQELKDCVQQLDRQTDQAKQELQSQDETRIRQCVDQLEELSDEAEKAAERANNVDDQVRDAIMQAHSELSNLKQQLH